MRAGDTSFARHSERLFTSPKLPLPVPGSQGEVTVPTFRDQEAGTQGQFCCPELVTQLAPEATDCLQPWLKTLADILFALPQIFLNFVFIF